MTKEEEKKLFDIVHTSKDVLKINLNNEKNLIGSDNYIFNLASYSFDRGLISEAVIILNRLEKNSKEYPDKVEYLQLMAKIYSSQNNDKQAILILNKLIDKTKQNINTETNNLLAASIKRDAFKDYTNYNDEKLLIDRLTISKDIYYSVYILSNDYYPLLNYIYLNFMLAHISNEDKIFFLSLQNNVKILWKNTNHKITDWWSFVSNIEYLILIGQYDKAKKELKIHFEEIDKNEITDFNISSTLRQLNLYHEFCNEGELKDIIRYIQEIN